MGCIPQSKAGRRYVRRTLQTMSAYVVLVFLVTYLVRHGHVAGVWTYVLALLPCIAILRLIHVVALYLSEESDEFQRMLVVRSILCGTAALLVVQEVSDFLRSYTPTGDLPPFALFTVFWIIFAIAQMVQRRNNRVGNDEEPA